RLLMDRRLQRCPSEPPPQEAGAAVSPAPDTRHAAAVERGACATSVALEQTQQQLAEARAGLEQTQRELEEPRVSLELLRNSRVVRATRPVRMLYHRLRGR